MFFNEEIIAVKKLRKLFGLSTYNDLREDIIEESTKLGDWRVKTMEQYLKKRDSETNESPYITYFFEYCQYCDEFLPESCFTKQSTINAKAMLLCSELRLNMKLLQDTL